MTAAVAALRLGRLGDLVMTLPALQWLSASDELELWLVTEEHYRELFAHLLPGVHVVASEQSCSLPPLDAVLDLHRVASSARVRARLPRRRGAPLIRVSKQAMLRRSLVVQPPLLNLVQGPIVAALGGPSALRTWPERHLAAAQQLFKGLGLVAPKRPLPVPQASLSMPPESRDPSMPLLGLALGAAWPLKRWTVEGFRKLALSWNDTCGGAVKLFAGPGEESLLDAIGDLPTATHSSGGSLLSLAAGLASCDVVVAADTGPLHLSGALGLPVVGLFGPTPVDSGFWVWDDRGIVIRAEAACSPCSLHGAGSCRFEVRTCMEDLQVREVLAAALTVREGDRQCA